MKIENTTKISFGFLLISLFLFSNTAYATQPKQDHEVLINKPSDQIIGKPTASIFLDYELPQNIEANTETTIKLSLNSKLQTEGFLSTTINLDKGLTLTSENSIDLKFNGNGQPLINELVFSAEKKGLFYININVIQRNSNHKVIQARNFVFPIQVGDESYLGKISENQKSKNNGRLVDSETSGKLKKIIEMMSK